MSTELTDEENKEIDDKVLNTLIEKTMTTYTDIAKKIEDREGVRFFHYLNPTEGYLWIVVCYEKVPFIFYPKRIRGEIASKKREVREIRRQERDPEEAKEAKQLLEEELARLELWKKEFRKKIYRRIRKDICVATTHYILMSVDMINPVCEDLITMLNNEKAKVLRNSDKYEKRKGATIIDVE